MLLNAATPLANVELTQTSQRHLTIPVVRPGRLDRLSFRSQQKSVAVASAIDLNISFAFRVSRLPDIGSATTSLFTAGGIVLQLDPNALLNASAPLRGSNIFSWSSNLGLVPLDEWQTVQLIADRSQTLTWRFNGRQMFSFTYNSPIWSLSPIPLNLGIRPPGSASITMRDIRIRLITFGPARSFLNVLRARILQLLALILVATGVGALAREFVGPLLPVGPSRGRSLVFVVFGIAGIGVLANLVFGLVTVHPASVQAAASTWLYPRYARFSDFFQPLGIFQSRDPYFLQGGTYPPLGYWLLSPFSWMSNYAAVLCAVAIFVGFLCWWCWRTFGGGLTWPARSVVVAVALTSFPVTFAIDRGNIDLLVLLLLVIAAGALEQRRYILSASIFALAGAAKFFPLAYLAVFLRRRRLTAFAAGVFVAFVVTAVTLASFLGTLGTQIQELRTNLSFLQSVYSNASVSTAFNGSITGFVQAIGYAVSGTSGGQAVGTVAHRYLSIEELIGGVIVLAYIVFIERSTWRAVSVVTAAILLLPEVSGYYSLLYLFVPLALFVREAEVNRGTTLIAIIFGLLLAPKAYAFFGSPPFVDSSMLVTAPLLLALIAAVFHDGLVERRSGPSC